MVWCGDGGANRGLGYGGLGGLPSDSSVKVVAGCSGVGGEVEAVLEREGCRWGACQYAEKGVATRAHFGRRPERVRDAAGLAGHRSDDALPASGRA